MTEHTPGPWIAEYDDKGHYAYVTAPGAWHRFAEVCVRIEGTDYNDPEGLANLAAITATPDLLEALETMVTAFAGYASSKGQKEALEISYAAINLARTTP